MRKYCDQLSRRDLLRVGAVAAPFGLGMSLPGLLEAQSADSPSAANREVSLILLFLEGGPSTIDAFDLKPNAPSEFRGEFRPISTNVSGIEVCEHLPRLSQHADKFALLRNFTHTDSSHGPADHWMLTGYAARAGFNESLKPNNQYPSYGSIIAKELGPRGSVPPYVCLPKMHNSAGAAYLGATAAPFVVNANPNAPNFAVPDLAPPLNVPSDRLGNRRELLQTVDRFRQTAEAQANQSAKTLSTFQQKALQLMTSSETKAAFDIAQEPDALRDRYGRHSLGQSCLMARRLVEAGVRCVTLNHTNWDTHFNNFNILKDDLLPQLDSGLSALLSDLHERGLQRRTLVVVFGEFGRTPRINKDAGRDHWGPSNCIFLSGGGIAGGLVVGATNARGEKPADNPVGPADLAATVFERLGINAQKEFQTPEGRPIKIANDGRVLRELFA